MNLPPLPELPHGSGSDGLRQTAWKNANTYDMAKWLRCLEHENLALYHKVVTFRSILKILVYGWYITYLGFLIRIPCHQCDTPYRMLGVVLIITYGIRLLCDIWNVYFQFHYYGLMVSEIEQLKNSPNDYRFFHKVIPDLNRTSGLTTSNFISATMLIIILSFILLGTLWIGQHLCEQTCPRIFSAYRYLLLALYILEICIVVTATVIFYLKRAMGIEGVEKIIEIVCGKEEEVGYDEDDEDGPPQNFAPSGDDEAEQEMSEGDDDDELLALQQSQPPAGDTKDQEN